VPERTLNRVEVVGGTPEEGSPIWIRNTTCDVGQKSARKNRSFFATRFSGCRAPEGICEVIQLYGELQLTQIRGVPNLTGVTLFFIAKEKRYSTLAIQTDLGVAP